MKNVVVITSKRPENYIYKAIGTIKEQIPIHLFVSGTDTDYLNKISSDKRISITTVEHNDKDNKILNQFQTFRRCIQDGYINGERGILVFEDDVLFANGWKKRFELIVSDLESKYERFVLSLFTNLPLCTPDKLPPSYYLPLNTTSFGGALGMYYTDFARRTIMDYFDKYDMKKTNHYDIVVRNCLIENNIPMFVAIPCLVEHTGIKSSWRTTSYVSKAIVFHNDLN